MNPKPCGRLFPMEELIAAQEKYEKEEFEKKQRKLAEIRAEAERAPAEKKPPFVYQARSPELWDARANQVRQKPMRRRKS
jgi:hypothetical protein